MSAQDVTASGISAHHQVLPRCTNQANTRIGTSEPSSSSRLKSSV
jgi:hypothetical protein